MMQYVADAVLLVQQWVHGSYGSRYGYGYTPGNMKKKNISSCSYVASFLPSVYLLIIKFGPILDEAVLNPLI